MMANDDVAPKTAGDLADALGGLLEEIGAMDADDLANSGLEMALPLVGAHSRSFEDAGILTRDAGLVVRFPGGVEYQITVVRSK